MHNPSSQINYFETDDGWRVTTVGALTELYPLNGVMVPTLLLSTLSKASAKPLQKFATVRQRTRQQGNHKEYRIPNPQDQGTQTNEHAT
jgi:hypothetical protein